MNHDPVSPEISQESCPIDQSSSCCGGKHASTSQEHWDKTYKGAPFERLGWFESSPQPCLDLIQKCNLSFSDTLLIAGAGASTLVDVLLDQGYQRLGEGFELVDEFYHTYLMPSGEERKYI